MEEPSDVDEIGPVMSNEVLALGVILTSFVLLGAFLWIGRRFWLRGNWTRLPAPRQWRPRPHPHAAPSAAPSPAAAVGLATRIPYEKNGGNTIFLDPSRSRIVRAEGHYTHALHRWRATLLCLADHRGEAAPGDAGFLKVHRSYLINPAHVAAFERQKDKGVCYFETIAVDVPPVPVSRSNLKSVRDALGA